MVPHSPCLWKKNSFSHLSPGLNLLAPPTFLDSRVENIFPELLFDTPLFELEFLLLDRHFLATCAMQTGNMAAEKSSVYRRCRGPLNFRRTRSARSTWFDILPDLITKRYMEHN